MTNGKSCAEDPMKDQQIPGAAALQGLAAWLRAEASRFDTMIARNDPAVAAHVDTLRGWAKEVDMAQASPSSQPAAAPNPVALQHVAVAEDGGKLRWMTGRKPRDCELYAMPDGGRAPTLYAAPHPAPAPAVIAELASMTRMFHAACHDLGLINEALGLDPEDGGAAPILEAIEELKARVTSANETGAEGNPNDRVEG